MLLEGLAVGARFVGAARRYWIGVFPPVCGELAQWRRRAGAIPDPTLRRLALDAQRKQANMEGAAVFAAYAPRRARAAAVRAAVAFQSAYNYLDLLSEQPCADPIANARSLHGALTAALQPDAQGHENYYEHAFSGQDGGYLAAMVDRCRDALRTLPSVQIVADAARGAAERVIAFQSLNLGEANGDHRLLAQWAQQAAPPGSGLRWWETAAAAGSSLGVHVMIAAASDPHLGTGQVHSLERAYFPWIGALHSLLDNIVDLTEDARTGERSLISYYSCAEEAAARMRWLVERSRTAVGELPDRQRHVMFLAAMTGMYLSAPQASDPRVRLLRGEILDAIGQLARPTLLVFAIRRCFGIVKSAVRRRGRDAVSRPAQGRRRVVGAMGCAAEVEEPWGATSPVGRDRLPTVTRAGRERAEAAAAAAGGAHAGGERTRIPAGVGGAAAR